MIALNFEAALRVSYTSNILALKKQLFTSEIQEAKYEAIEDQMKEKDLELLSYETALSTLQKENSKQILEYEQYRRSGEAMIQKLKKENSDIISKLDDATFSNVCKDSDIEELNATIKQLSSQNEALNRQVKHTSQKIEKTEDLAQKLAKVSKMLKNEYIF